MLKDLQLCLQETGGSHLCVLGFFFPPQKRTPAPLTMKVKVFGHEWPRGSADSAAHVPPLGLSHPLKSSEHNKTPLGAPTANKRHERQHAVPTRNFACLQCECVWTSVHCSLVLLLDFKESSCMFLSSCIIFFFTDKRRSRLTGCCCFVVYQCDLLLFCILKGTCTDLVARACISQRSATAAWMETAILFN